MSIHQQWGRGYICMVWYKGLDRNEDDWADWNNSGKYEVTDDWAGSCVRQ